MLRRTEMKRSETPMNRGEGFKRTKSLEAKPSKLPLRPVAGDKPAPARAKQRKRLKTTRQKLTAIRASARDEECTLRLHGVCNYRTDTTVLCHRNGAGAGMKSGDDDACYGCFACHTVLDGHAPRPASLTREAMLARFEVAVGLTRDRRRVKGLLTDAEKQKPPPADTGNGFNLNQLKEQ